MNIPKISRKQMEMVLEELPEVTFATLEGMLKEIPTKTWGADAVEIALVLVEAIRGGSPALGPNGKTFTDVILAWEPWKWDDSNGNP